MVPWPSVRRAPHHLALGPLYRQTGMRVPTPVHTGKAEQAPPVPRAEASEGSQGKRNPEHELRGGVFVNKGAGRTASALQRNITAP